MKKLLAMVFVVALVMAGCNGTPQKESETTATTITTPVQTSSAAEASNTSAATTSTETTSTETTSTETTSTETTTLEHPLLAKGFEQKEGYMEFLELEKSPISGGGLRIQFFPEEMKLHMIKTDSAGNDTVEYLTFRLDKKEVEKYRYVSMMGTGFYYYYNIEKEELYKIENDSHTDKTESTKEAGRFENAYNEVKEEVKKIGEYFGERFMPMDELGK